MKMFEKKPVENGGVADRKGVHLLRSFAIASLIAFVAVAALMGYLFRTVAIDGQLKATEIEHIKMAQLIGSETWDDAFGPWMQTTRGKSAQELRDSLEIPAIKRKMMLRLKGTRVFRIKAYDSKAMTVFSTELSQIGQDKSDNVGVRAGLLGLSSSRLVHRDQVSHFEGEVQTRDLVESYVPHYDRASGKVVGVFEIYGDASALLADINRQQWYLVLVVIGPLALLYLALFIIVKRAQDSLLRNKRERKEDKQ